MARFAGFSTIACIYLALIWGERGRSGGLISLLIVSCDCIICISAFLRGKLHFYLDIIQYFQDAHTTEQKMIQLVERLNSEYDVQNISTRDAAEQALNSLTVSAWDQKKLNF